MMRMAFALGLALLVCRFAAADEPSYDRAVKPLLEQHCIACHGAEKAKGDLRLDGAAPDLANAKVRGVNVENNLRRLFGDYCYDITP